MNRRILFFRPVAAITAAAFGLAGCVQHHWHTVPAGEAPLAKEDLSKRKVRFTLDGGSVTLLVRGVAYPFVDGSVDSVVGAAVVAVDLGHVRKIERLELDAGGRELQRTAVPADQEGLESQLLSRTCSFLTEDGPAVLAVGRLAFPLVVGRPQVGPGRVRIDVREVRKMEVFEVAGGKTALATGGLTAGVVVALILVVAVVAVIAFVKSIAFRLAFSLRPQTLAPVGARLLPRIGGTNRLEPTP